MRRFSFGFARLAQRVTAALLAVALVPAAAQAADYSFSIDGPNTAVNPDNDDVLQTTGAGTFDTTDGGVVAHGRFTHLDSDGAVIVRGRWSATAFVGFDSFGGPSPGFQAGVLDITVDFFPVGGDAVTGLAMRVVCDVPGFTTGEPIGTTVGDFNTPTGGFTLFNHHQN